MQTALMFHGIGEVRSNIPIAERPYWISKALFRDILSSVRLNHATKVVWTFDDGNRSDLDAAVQLAEAGLHGKFFVLTSRIGSPNYLSASHLRELVDMGMEVGSHGRDHVDWRTVDDKTLTEEIVESGKAIADIIGREVHSIAIPFGHYDRRVFDRLDRSPYLRIYSSDTGPTRPGARFIRRNPVMAGEDVNDIEAVVADQVPFARRFRRTFAPILKRRVR